MFAAGVGLGMVTLSRNVFADDKKPAGKPDTRSAFLETVYACIVKGEACQAHCQSRLANGEKEFAHCHAAVTDMVEVCRATASLVARQSAHAKEQVAACVAVCKECSAACLEHKAHFAHGMHLECKACMEACDLTVKAASALS